MKISDLNTGDKVRISRIITIQGNGGIYSVTDTDKNIYYDRESYFKHMSSPDKDEEKYLFDFELVEKAVPKTPKHWPVQNGDVWRAKDGKEWHSIDGLSTVYRSSGSGTRQNCESINTTELMGMEPELVYRRGNSF